ncbi:MAG: LbtU family siderophore porin [Kiritimatiellae bacterium]|nr:LbtU family siderophore porin [Kiritimatiellia bacterium]
MNKFLATAAALCACTTGAAFADEAPAAEPAEKVDAPLVQINLPQGLTLEGLLELSGSWTKQGDEKETDLNMDTVELDFGWDVSEELKVNVNLLWEEGEDFCVDEAAFEYALPGVEGLAVRGGWLYMPFGVFDFGSPMVSDPLTLELAEINDAAIGLQYGDDFFGASVYAFKGDIDDDSDDMQFAAAVDLKSGDLLDGVALAFHFGFLSDIGEAAMDDDINDRIKGGTDEDGNEIAPADYDAACAFDVAVALEIEDCCTLAAEYVFAADDMEFDGEAAGKPQAWAVDFVVPATERLTLALRYGGSKEFNPEEFPEMQWGAAAEYAFDDNVALALEYMYGRYEKADDGVRPDDSHAVTAKIAVSF